MDLLQNPVLAHIHVPKCAGTSFTRQLSEHFGPAHLELYCNHDTFFVYPEQELAGYVENPGIKAFSSHFCRTFPTRLAGRKVLYVTFLRKPVDQFISYLTYVRKNFDAIQHHSELMSCLPPDLPSLSLREASRWILTHEEDINFKENHTVNFFARFPYRAAFGDSADRINREHYQSTRLALAQIVLKSFLLVGITEQMDRSVASLRSLAEQSNISFPHMRVAFENVSYEGRGDLSWINAKDEVGSLLLESVREDQQLYDFALARLNTENCCS